jgi:hypothetical protein
MDRQWMMYQAGRRAGERALWRWRMAAAALLAFGVAGLWRMARQQSNNSSLLARIALLSAAAPPASAPATAPPAPDALESAPFVAGGWADRYALLRSPDSLASLQREMEAGAFDGMAAPASTGPYIPDDAPPAPAPTVGNLERLMMH